MTERYLIVNADDFGQSHGINRGIIEAHENGVVTSASLMVRWPAALEAAAYARQQPDLGVGLHLDFGEWVFRDGSWFPLYQVVATEDAAGVEQEVQRQLKAFRDLLHRDPTHIDSHQHAHRHEPAHSIVKRVCDELGIPCRGFSAAQYCGSFYGQTGTGEALKESITVDALVGILSRLPSGVTELGCHPGFGADLDTMYVHEREQEVHVLCDRRVRQAIDAGHIALCRFHEVVSR
jgi:predicted glycoside hydrolase/deacetylase ChbG (UPF0249 family)